MSKKKRFAIVGMGSRSSMFTTAILKDFPSDAELVAICDINQSRMDYWNAQFKEKYSIEPLPTYKPSAFETMIKENRIETVIVTTVDRTHHRYICRAMDAGCDVISEKPMTVDGEKCHEILDTIKRTGKNLRVTFNYRYAPRNSKVKELLQAGAIGDVKSVHFEWLLNTKHGADYFRRWHRDKRNSGGLMVHKATHHFDLVNWWLDSTPEEVYAKGDLVFYGRENAEERGVEDFYHRSTGDEKGEKDPFGLSLSKEKDETLHQLYKVAEKDDGYLRDQSVFGDGISIEDDMSVLVSYENKAKMTYHLTAYSPWEGYRVMFNGTKGRLEYECVEKAYVSGGEDDHNLATNIFGGSAFEIKEPSTILLRPLWGEIVSISVDSSNEGGHGGGDSRMLEDIFLKVEDDPLNRAAGEIDGAKSILTGIAANRSMSTGLPVKVRDLVDLRNYAH